MVSIKILGGLNRFYGYPTSPSASVMAQNMQLFGPHEGFLTHQWIITDEYYDETEMRTRPEKHHDSFPQAPGCVADGVIIAVFRFNTEV